MIKRKISMKSTQKIERIPFNIKYTLLLFIMLPFLSCQEQFTMIDPPSNNNNEDSTEVDGYFVKTNGTGEGTSWDDAMSPEDFISKLNDGFETDDNIYIAGGVYYTGKQVTDVMIISKALNIVGGFDPNSSGNNIEIQYPSTYETVFSADLNNNNKPDVGDCRVIEITTIGTITLKGITLTNGFVSEGENRPCIQINNGARLELEYCKITNNKSAITASANAGGAAIYIKNGTVNCFKTEISGNRSDNRGGAIRLAESNSGSSTLILNSCLIKDNVLTGAYGGAIQVSGSNCPIYCINTTITNNTANLGGAGINSGFDVFLVNSSVVNNTCNDGTQGHDIRCESTNKFVIINSIVTGNPEKTNNTNPSICINGATRSIISRGYNIIGNYGGTGSFTTHSTDVYGKYINDVFGINTLDVNNGYPFTIALKQQFTGASLATLLSFAMSQFPYGDIAVDQRGETRADPSSIGAFEYK